MKKSFFLAILFFGKILAQTDSTYFSADILSEILESYNIKNESAVEILTRLHENPIDLNSADFSTLRTLPFLSVAQIQSLLKLRNSLPDGISNYSSLLSLPEFDMQDVEALRYFTLLKAKSNFPKISAKYKTRANRCYSDFSSNDFEGNLFKTYGRLFLNYANNYSINVLLKKDAGEKSYADFTSFYFKAQNLFSKFTLLLGDYQMEFGQGLALWNPYAFGKSSADAEAVIRSARGIFGNTLTAEGQGFRGIALKYSQSQFTVRTFYSNRKLSASLDSTQNLITAIDYSGYHRTPKEISKKGRLQLNSYGLSIEKNWGENFRTGILFLSQKLTPSLLSKTGGLIANLITFSFSYSYISDNIFLCGEIARTNSSLATTNGLSIELNKSMRFVSQIRSYSHDYFSLWANGVGEFGTTANERGFYNALSFSNKYLRLIFYYDIFKRPYPSSNSLFPTDGHEFSIELKFRNFKRFKPTIRFFEERKNTAPAEGSISNVKNKLRLNFLMPTIRKVKAKTRLELSEFSENEKTEIGFLFLQDFSLNLFSRLSMNFRIIYFNTPSYRSRIYEFENGVYGTMENRALYGEGIRWYALARIKIFPSLILELKFAQQFFEHETNTTIFWKDIKEITLQLSGKF